MTEDVKKYLDLEGLQKYDEKIKAHISDAVDAEKTRAEAIEGTIGDINFLETSTNVTLVEAINAVNVKAAGASQKAGELETLVGKAATPETQEGAGDGTAATGLFAEIAQVQSNLDNVDVSGDIEAAITALDLANTYASKSVVDTLVGDDADKSVRSIANEELAKQLIPESANEALDTLAEIAAWIQAHPGDAATMNQQIAALQSAVGVPAKAAVTHEATQEDVDAGKAENIGDIVVDEAAVEATGLNKNVSDVNKALDNRLDVVEEALGLGGTVEGQNSVAERLATVEEKVDAFTAISEDEINALFAEPTEG